MCFSSKSHQFKWEHKKIGKFKCETKGISVIELRRKKLHTWFSNYPVHNVHLNLYSKQHGNGKKILTKNWTCRFSMHYNLTAHTMRIFSWKQVFFYYFILIHVSGSFKNVLFTIMLTLKLFSSSFNLLFLEFCVIYSYLIVDNDNVTFTLVLCWIIVMQMYLLFTSISSFSSNNDIINGKIILIFRWIEILIKKFYQNTLNTENIRLLQNIDSNYMKNWFDTIAWKW